MVSWVGWWSTTFRGSIGVSAAHGGDDGSAGRRTTLHGEISDLYGQRDFREREVFVRNSFEFPSV
jgi:hypothetical protein